MLRRSFFKLAIRAWCSRGFISGDEAVVVVDRSECKALVKRVGDIDDAGRSSGSQKQIPSIFEQHLTFLLQEECHGSQDRAPGDVVNEVTYAQVLAFGARAL